MTTAIVVAVTVTAGQRLRRCCNEFKSDRAKRRKGDARGGRIILPFERCLGLRDTGAHLQHPMRLFVSQIVDLVRDLPETPIPPLL
jgi:hypothetical protein